MKNTICALVASAYLLLVAVKPANLPLYNSSLYRQQLASYIAEVEKDTIEFASSQLKDADNIKMVLVVNDLQRMEEANTAMENGDLPKYFMLREICRVYQSLEAILDEKGVQEYQKALGQVKQGSQL